MEILAIAFVTFVVACAIYFSQEHSAMKNVIATQNLQNNHLSDLLKKLKETDSRIEFWKSSVKDYKSQVDLLQDHCARLREQQQGMMKQYNVLLSNQQKLRTKIMPQNINLTITEKMH